MKETWMYIFNEIDKLNDEIVKLNDEIVKLNDEIVKLNNEFITMVHYGKIPEDEIKTAMEEYVKRLTYEDLVNPFVKSNLESQLKKGGYDYLFLGELFTKARTKAGIGVVEERGYKGDSEKKSDSVENSTKEHSK